MHTQTRSLAEKDIQIQTLLPSEDTMAVAKVTFMTNEGQNKQQFSANDSSLRTSVHDRMLVRLADDVNRSSAGNLEDSLVSNQPNISITEERDNRFLSYEEEKKRMA